MIYYHSKHGPRHLRVVRLGPVPVFHNEYDRHRRTRVDVRGHVEQRPFEHESGDDLFGIVQTDRLRSIEPEVGERRRILEHVFGTTIFQAFPKCARRIARGILYSRKNILELAIRTKLHQLRVCVC